MTKSADDSVVLLHRITKPTAWRGGVQILKEEEEDVRPMDRCEERGNIGQGIGNVTRMCKIK